MPARYSCIAQLTLFYTSIHLPWRRIETAADDWKPEQQSQRADNAVYSPVDVVVVVRGLAALSVELTWSRSSGRPVRRCTCNMPLTAARALSWPSQPLQPAVHVSINHRSIVKRHAADYTPQATVLGRPCLPPYTSSALYTHDNKLLALGSFWG